MANDGPVTTPDETITSPTQVDPTGNAVTQPGQAQYSQGDYSNPDPSFLSRYAAPDPSLSTPGSSSSSTSSSTRGMTDAGLKRSGDLFQQADQQAADDMVPLNKELDQERADVTAHTGMAEDAASQQAAADVAHYQRMQGLEDRKRDLFDTAAEMEKTAAAEGKAVRAHYMSTLENQLAGVAQLAKSTGNPIADLSRTQALGLAGARFVQGFLATRGINIDVGSQIDHWVDTSIKEHQMKIDNARGAAQDTLHLYDIARQSSQDDYEARQRYRGMVIEGLQAQVTGEAARYGAASAGAHAQSVVAQLELHKDEVKRALGARAEQQYVQIKQMRIGEAMHKGQLAVEYSKIADSRANREAAAKASADKLRQRTNYFSDPTTGLAVARITKGTVNDQQRAKVAMEARSGYMEMKPLLNEYVRLYRKADEQGWLGKAVTDASDPEFRRLSEVRDRIALINTKITNGTRSSDQEFDRQLGLVPNNKAYQRGDNDALVNDLMGATQRNFQATMNSVSDSFQNEDGSIGITPEERKMVVPEVGTDRALKTEVDAFDNGKARGPATPNERLYAVATGSKDKKSSVNAALQDSMDPTFQVHDPHTTDNLSGMWVKAEGGGYKNYKKEQPGWAVSMDLMADHAARGLTDKWGPDHQDAATALASIARGENHSQQDRMDYAAALLKELTSNPKGLLAELHPTARTKGESHSLGSMGANRTGMSSQEMDEKIRAMSGDTPRDSRYLPKPGQPAAATRPSVAPPDEPDLPQTPDGGVGDENE